MSLRAKFQVSNVTKTASGDEIVAMVAVVGGSDENKQWSKYTPAGSLSMTISNPEAQGKLVPGQSYYLDIMDAPG